MANDAGNRSVVYRNDGLGALRPIAGLGSGMLSEARRAIALADLDDDGDLDAVLVGEGQDHLYLNDGTGAAWQERQLGGEPGRGLAVAVGDFDSDSSTDIAVAYRGPGRVVVYRNDGMGRFGEATTLGEDGSDPTGLAVGDLDGDRDLDLVAVSWKRPHTLYFNDGRGAFPNARPFGTGAEQAWSIALGDVDLDGDLDVAVGAANVAWWYDDFEGDGTPDRFGNERGAAPSRIFMNDGAGALTPGAVLATGSDDTRPIAFGDVDGDGDLDVVMGNDYQPNYVFFNSLRAVGPR